MKEIRIGIIGTGVISQRHMTVWEKIPDVKIVCGADISRKVLDQWGEKYGVTDLYTDFRDLLARDDIDAVDVCVHNNLHVPISIAAMKAGKHVYCEKPMAGSYRDAKLLYDAQKVFNKKLAIQISSIFNMQSRVARDMIARGDLGRIYHARTYGFRRLGRPGADIQFLSPDFFSAEFGGHGPLFDMGVYRISQMLFAMGMPQLDCVFGAAYQEIEIDDKLLGGKPYEVEDFGVGLARFKNGLTMDIVESWAVNIDQLGSNFITGSKGGLKFVNLDAYGGPMANPELAAKQPLDLEFYGIENGMHIDKKLNIPFNQRLDLVVNPQNALFDDNQRHWLAYLNDELTDETRYDTPWIALQTMLVSEGIFLSQQLGRSVTADEIDAMSESNAVRRQNTDWGVIEYDF